MLGGNHARLGLADRILTVLVSTAMIFATFAYAIPLPAADAALGVTSFEIGSEEPDTGSIAGLIQGSPDWASLTPDSNGVLLPGEVLIINDENNTPNMGILTPATEATVESNCNSTAEVILNQGQDINSYPFVIDPSGSVPDKVNICQVYVAYDVAAGDTILYVGVTRLKVTGTVALAIELNRTAYNDRMVNDLLVTFEFDGGGAASDIRVRRWTGSAWSAPIDVPDDGDSYQHFGEIAVNLSATNLLPPPTSADDCSSFSSIAPYGFRGESDSSQVGDWAGSVPVVIPRCGQLKISKVADPATTVDFGWTLSSSFPNLTGTIQHGETKTLDLNEGTYSLTETTIPSPYQLDEIVCNDGNVDPSSISMTTGTNVSCVIYNHASSLIVKKVGDGDGSAEFNFNVTGQSPFNLSLGGTSSTFVYAPGSSVDISESLPSGDPQWSANGVVCKNDAGDTVASAEGASISSVLTVAGDTITCTFTNTQDSLLTLEKFVINDDGGTAVDTDWTLHANGVGALPDISGAEGDSTVTDANVPAGVYDLSESNGPGGYNFVGVECDGGSLTDETLTLSPGDVVTCTFTNDDLAPGLTLVKEVHNDDGGGAVPADFQLLLNDSPADQGAVDGALSNTKYTLSEESFPGYEQVGDVVCVDDDTDQDVGHPVTLDEGQSVTCTITNDDLESSITVIKELVPDGAADPNDFSLTITPEGGDSIATMSGEIQEVDANETYTVGETLLDGFVQLDLSCEDSEGPVAHPVELALGQDVTCTITNAESPTITVIKTTDPVDSSLFEFNLNGAEFFDVREVAGNGGSFTWDALEPGSYDLTEDTPVDWLLESVECDAEFESLEEGAGLFVDYGDHVTCVFGNGELGSITVIKETDVETDELFDISFTSEGGTESVLLGDGDSNTWDLLVPGTYSVEELLDTLNWAIGLSCEPLDATFQVGPVVLGPNGPGTQSRGASITLGFGDDVICTFTNTAVPTDLEITKIDLVDPVVVDSDNPTALITYEVTVTNNGPASAEAVVVTDNLPDSLTFVSAVPQVGTCSHAAGVVTCALGDMAVGASVKITIVVETEAVGSITDFSPLNVVEVSSDTKDSNPDNNVDDEMTNIIEILDLEILPFTGMDSEILLILSLGLAFGGAVLLFVARRREEDLDH